MKTLAVLLILLLFPSLSSAQTPKGLPVPKDNECRISGMVVKLAGTEPLKNARIQLTSQDDRAVGHSTTTDAGGRFNLKGIDPGRYRLVVRRDGFVTQEYGQKKPDDPGAILTLRAKQEMNDLLFRMIPSAVIAGRVINDDGDPLPWVQVSALREVYAAGKKDLFPETTGPTNDLGEYRLFGLRPGRYFIRAEYKPEEQITGPGQVERRDDESPRGYVPMYYPSSTEPAHAITVEVKAGEEIPALEILLRRVDVFSVRGRLYNMISPRSNTNYTLSLSPRGGDGWLSLPQREAIIDYKNGTFAIRDVLPRPYVLSAFLFDEGRRYRAYRSVDVGNADVEGVGLTLLTGMSLNGRVAWDGQPTDTSRLTVYLHDADNPYGYGGRATVTPPWAFVLNDVYDLTYRVGVAGLCDDCYLKAVRYGTATSSDDTFTPARGSNAPLELTISSKAVRLRGSVTDADNLPAIGVWVVLVPDEAHRTSRRLYKSASTDQYGRFELRGIAPGDYKLFSWEEVESGAWEDPEFLKEFEAKGEKISLQEGEQKSIDLKAIRAKAPESFKP